VYQSPSLFREAATYGREDPGAGSFIHKLSLLAAPAARSSVVNAHEEVQNRNMIQCPSSVSAGAFISQSSSERERSHD